MNPITQVRREPVLDALRGFAILGILLIGIEVVRSPDLVRVAQRGTANPPSGLIDSTVGFAIEWLATGKFVSSLAILFGVGAALMAARALRENQSPLRDAARARPGFVSAVIFSGFNSLYLLCLLGFSRAKAGLTRVTRLRQWQPAIWSRCKR